MDCLDCSQHIAQTHGGGNSMRRDGAHRPRPSEGGEVLAHAAMILDMSCCATILLRRTCSIRETKCYSLFEV